MADNSIEECSICYNPNNYRHTVSVETGAVTREYRHVRCCKNIVCGACLAKINSDDRSAKCPYCNGQPGFVCSDPIIIVD